MHWPPSWWPWPRPKPPVPPLPPVPPGPVANDNAEVLRLINVERVQRGLKAVATNAMLSGSAQSYAGTMDRLHRLDHFIGGTPDSREKAAGYNPSKDGEIIAEGQTTPAEVVDDWMHSAGHRAEILDPAFKDMGAGRAGNYWCVDFGVPMGAMNALKQMIFGAPERKRPYPGGVRAKR